MSGNYGWGGRDRDDSFTADDYSDRDSGFTRAHSPYGSVSGTDFSRGRSLKDKANNPDSVRMTRAAANSVPATRSRSIDLSPRKSIKTTKDNVIIVAMDTTGSMGQWRQEIMDRLALMYNEAVGYLGDSLEVIFIGFGDLVWGDAFEATPPGSGPELSEFIGQMTHGTNGGGNLVESSEMTAVYVHMLVDTSSAKRVFFFIITDEGHYASISEDVVRDVLGVTPNLENFAAKHVFNMLKRRMRVFTILPKTNCYSDHETRGIRKQWDDTLGCESIIPLDDSRRVVDVMLGAVAKTTGQYDQFSRDLNTRQAPTQHGKVNIRTVHASLVNVGGGPSAPPAAGTKSLADLAPKDVAGVGSISLNSRPKTGTK